MWADLSPPYGTIVADPPWRYTVNPADEVTLDRSAEKQYDTMSMADLCALPVADIAAPNAHLYMWVTNPRLFRGRSDPLGPIDIIDAWGFRYITLLTWVKEGAPGMGFYFRGNTEHVIFAIRGDAPIPADRRESNVFAAPKRGHSEKPECFLDLVERVSPGPRVELFARRRRFGWDTWGAQA